MNKNISYKFSLWTFLAGVVLLSNVARIISILQGGVDGIYVLDLFINLVVMILLFMKSILGLIILTFGVLLGFAVSISQGAGPEIILQVILLLASIPLWIQRFSSK